jgi:putative cell wall-binding protein
VGFLPGGYFRERDGTAPAPFDLMFTSIDTANLGDNPYVEVTYRLDTWPPDPTTFFNSTHSVTLDSNGLSFPAGDGTRANPYQVTTVENLRDVGCISGHVALMNDLDMTGHHMDPIGWPFIGEGGPTKALEVDFDGRGHTISNLTINRPNDNDVGLFREMDYSEIRNLHLVDAEVNGRGRVGILFGSSRYRSVLRNISITRGTVKGQRLVGLIAGLENHGQHTSLNVSGSVTIVEGGESSKAAGGLFGEGKEITVEDSRVVATITNEHDPNNPMSQISDVGGLVGRDLDHMRFVNVDAAVFINLRANTIRDIGGAAGDGNQFGFTSGSRINVAIDLTSTDPNGSIRRVGGFTDRLDYSVLRNSVITGTITLTTAAGSNNPVVDIGGVVGWVGTSRSTITRSHFDVDVTVNGSAQSVGALGGSLDVFVGDDLRVDGMVRVTGDATEVGGLVGKALPRSGGYGVALTNVIWRGTRTVEGAELSAVPSQLWGNATVSAGSVFGGAFSRGLYWQSSTVASDPMVGDSATATQLGTSSWLAARGFNMNIWCVSGGQPAIIALVSGCDPTVVSVPGGGGASGVRVAEPVRVGGVNRFATAATLSQRFFGPRVPVVYLATAEDFADALAAGPLAAGNGPVLMVLRNEIPAATLAELRRLNPGRVVVLGGPAAVSDAVLDAARATTTGSVTRLFGTDRYATAVAIAKTNHAQGASVVYVATGADFADALGGGPRAMRDGGPILLVQRDVIPSVTLAEIERLSPDRIVVLGGPNAVSEAVARKLRAFAPAGVSRLAGMDRYATSVAISQAGFEPGVEVVFLANGRGYGDALPAGAAAGGRGPVLLVREDCVPLGVYRELERLKAGEVIMVGGTAALGDGVTSLRLCAS